MSQYTDNKNSLNHGLGVGGGRGRPKGSRNGYINPNAAYMKDYKVVGEIAQDPEEQTQMFRPGNRANFIGTYEKPARMQRGATGQPVQRVNTQKTASRPVSSVQVGKDYLNNLLKVGDGSTGSNRYGTYTRDLLDVHDNPTSQPLHNRANIQITEARDADEGPNVRLGGGSTEKPAEPAAINNAGKETTGQIGTLQENKITNSGKDSAGKIETREIPKAIDKAVEEVKTAAKEAGEAAGTAVKNVLDQAGETVRNAANAVGTGVKGVVNEADRLWNGYEKTPYGSPEDREKRLAGETEHVDGLKDIGNEVKANVEQTLVDAGDQVKTWWDDLLSWGAQAAEDVGKFATKAINTGAKAFNTAKDWIGERFDDAGSWASTAYQDVSDWIGDRGKELDRWWNGYEGPALPENKSQSLLKDHQHVSGARENIVNAVNNAAGTAGKWITDRAVEVGDAAKNAVGAAGQWLDDRGGELDRWWNGYDQLALPENKVQSQLQGQQHVSGARENIASIIDQAGRAIGGAADTVIRTVRDAAGNVRQAVVDTAGNVVGWIEDRAEEADRAWNGYEGPELPENKPQSQIKDMESQHVNGIRENLEEIAGAHVEKLRDIAGNVRDAIVDAKGQFVDWVEELPEKVGTTLQNAGKAVAEAGENAVSAARTADGAGADLLGDNIVGWTNSPIAQEAQRQGLSTGLLNALAAAYLTPGPNGVDRNAFENMLYAYATGDANEENLLNAIRDIHNK